MRIKVIHVVTRLDLGGAQQNTLYTATNLDASRFDCLVVAGAGGILDAEVDTGKVRIRFLDCLVREISPGKDLLALLQLMAVFIAEKPDIVHTHSSKAGILGRLAAFLAGVPVAIHTYHGFGFNDFQSYWRKKAYVLAERLCARLARCLIYVSQANWDYARNHELGALSQYRLIRSGIELAQFPVQVNDRGQKKASLGLGKHKPLIISIGNLKPQKNPGDFVAMAHKVSPEFADAEFLFIGDGPLRKRLEYQIIASGLSHRLSLPGWRRDAGECLAISDIFVLTSLWEGLPRALVEAMKTGLPCVCYAADGIADIMKDGVNGFIVPIGNVSLLAQRIMQLLKDPALRKKMGQRAAQSIGDEFDIDLMVRAQEKLYDELLMQENVPQFRLACEFKYWYDLFKFRQF